MSTKKTIIQDINYTELIKANINKISSRYLAYKLAEIENEIEAIQKIEQLKLKIICNKGVFLVTLPDIPIPDAKIELM